MKVTVVTLRFVDKPCGGCRAAGTMEWLHGRRTNHGTIEPLPCYRRWWVHNNNIPVTTDMQCSTTCISKSVKDVECRLYSAISF